MPSALDLAENALALPSNLAPKQGLPDIEERKQHTQGMFRACSQHAQGMLKAKDLVAKGSPAGG